ncbi:MAG: carboxylesterase family protein [Acidimicrobiales bacterium]
MLPTARAGGPGVVVEPVVTIASGTLRGIRDGNVERFLGVPYAAPPFGERRMRPPQPVEAWPGERDATQFGPTVPKAGYAAPYDELLPEPAVPGEDCLNLNVWTPDTAGRAPVLVWIHGGAFLNGSGIVPQYDGTAFARDGVVCVTINYRLGADGFLDVGDEATNVGLQDQIAALRWVRNNIAAFGGDPAWVTIAGESAGAMSVGCLLSTPRTEGLFIGAILQSGAGHHAISRSSAQKVSAELAERLAIEATRDAFAGVPVERLVAAQSELSVEIQTAPDPAKWGEVAANLMPFEPVIDETLLSRLPIQSIATGTNGAVRVLAGTNADENLLFMVPNGAIGFIDDAILSAAVGGFGFKDPDAVIALYRSNRPSATPGELLAAVADDWLFAIPAVRLAEARESGAPTFVYEFAWKSPIRGGSLGACHALEIPFVFDTLGTEGADWLTGSDPPQVLADTMHRAWVSFVTDGDPGWDPYRPADRTVMRFADTCAVITDPASEEREAWSGVR